MDAVALTRTLLQFDTINPPGRERDCAHHAGAMLQEWGYTVEYHEYADSRTSVIARGGGNDTKKPLCLTGHLDVVSLGTRKGSLKFNASFRGVSAHGSMPHLGENAVYKAARAVAKLEAFDFKAKKHPIMGEPTLNVGTFEGGSGVNLVPDLAKIGVDVRTVP